MSRRKIEALEARLAAIEAREVWPLTPGENARLAGLVVRAGVVIHRGRSVAKTDRAVDRVFAGAARRVEVELAALRKVEEKKRQAEIETRANKAAAKAKKPSGWW